jgi:hypothetical protein
MIYKANPAYRIITDEEAAKIGPVLARLCKPNGTNPDDIVEAATPENSILHNHFTWDNDICGIKWRKQEARYLVNAIFDDNGMPAFESVNVLVLDEDSEELVSTGRVYKPTAVLLYSPDDWGLLKTEISHSLNAMRRKLKVYQDFVTSTQTMALDEAIEAFDK